MEKGIKIPINTFTDLLAELIKMDSSQLDSPIRIQNIDPYPGRTCVFLVTEQITSTPTQEQVEERCLIDPYLMLT